MVTKKCWWYRDLIFLRKHCIAYATYRTSNPSAYAEWFVKQFGGLNPGYWPLHTEQFPIFKK